MFFANQCQSRLSAVLEVGGNNETVAGYPKLYLDDGVSL